MGEDLLHSLYLCVSLSTKRYASLKGRFCSIHLYSCCDYEMAISSILDMSKSAQYSA